MSAAISLRSLTRRFDDTTAVDDLDLDIEAGAFFALLGPSGWLIVLEFMLLNLRRQSRRQRTAEAPHEPAQATAEASAVPV